ncbi:hypothetical protein ABIA32_000341 [Streptacidiphilus sp. MAP12-20]|uniref:hypothetical protein n=1 Tax=Streptacidiphilus sp. MAP12-20 TaxID=3156299 RepID=UPI003513E38D
MGALLLLRLTTKLPAEAVFPNSQPAAAGTTPNTPAGTAAGTAAWTAANATPNATATTVATTITATAARIGENVSKATSQSPIPAAPANPAPTVLAPGKSSAPTLALPNAR